jgi:hypothetical protein
MWLLSSNFEFSLVLAFAKNAFLIKELFKTIVPSLKYKLFLASIY